MPENNNNTHFDIPIPIIVLAFIFCSPIGIVLAILRLASSHANANQNNSRANEEFSSRKNNETATLNRSTPKKRKSKNKASPLTNISKIVSVICLILGIFVSIGMLADISFTISFLKSFFAATFPLFAFSGISYIVHLISSEKDSRLSRIRAIIGNRESINLSKLATASNVSLKKIRRDLQKLINSGEFGNYAYLDLGTNNFMRSPYSEPDEPDVFEYRKVYGKILDRNKKKDDPKNKQNTDDKNSKVEEISTEDETDFDKIIKEIRRLNDEIEDEHVSERIFRIEELTKNIFDYVTDHPEAMPQIRTFMNYYLPTTLKLLESYSRIMRVGIAGSNMKKSKEDIESILDLLVVGFEQQVDQLFKNESIDISSDISVLEQMMNKDGLSGKNDFDMSSGAEEGYTDGYCDDITDSGTMAK